MHVVVLYISLHIPAAQSLKAKRSVVTSLVRQLDQLHGVAAAEVRHHDVWQRTALGVSITSGQVGQAAELMASVERKIWSRTDVDVIGIQNSWWDNTQIEMD